LIFVEIFPGLGNWGVLFLDPYFSILLIISNQIWFEILFRGVILKILTEKYKTYVSLIISAFLSSITLQLPSIISLFYFIHLINIFMRLILTIALHYFFGYLTHRTKSFIPSFFIIITRTLIGVNPLFF
jgi:hypothetical protein